MRLPSFRCLAAAACLVCSGLWSAPADALTVQLDYTYDNGFFTNVAVNPDADAARAALEQAARSFEMYVDDLEAIVPGGVNTWEARFWRPDTGTQGAVADLVVPAETVIFFAGARDLGGSLGVGGPGWASATSTVEWFDTLRYRGQEGAAETPASDFGPWGGTIAFNSEESWSFDLDAPPAGPGEHDFYSVAVHEMCHALGFGIADSWKAHVTGSHEFTGTAATAAFGGPVPLDGIDVHWAEDTLGAIGTVDVQEAGMDPTLLVGSRKRLTALDHAGLVDIGWELPSPGDADHDGDVDVWDYVTLKRHFNSSGGWEDGDMDFDGDVDYYDYAALRDHFGESSAVPGPPGAPAGALPEPGMLAITSLTALALLRRRPPRR